MKDIIWGETLSVGITEIDEDHRKLVDLYNLLIHAVADEETTIYLDALMEELITCTAGHFKHEERLMLKYGYEGLESHRAEHQDLIESGKVLHQKLLQNGNQVPIEYIRSLERWLIGHILGTDMDLGAYLSEKM